MSDMVPQDLHIDRDHRWKRVVAEWVERVTWKHALAIGLVMAASVSVVDHALAEIFSYDFSLTPLYCLPVAVAAWIAGFRCGIAVAVGATAFDLSTTVISSHHRHGNSILLINVFFASGAYLGTAYVMAELRWHLERERKFSRLDPVTGVCNLRALNEAARSELERLRRYDRPVSIAYIDVDDFKCVNDTLGHGMGDKLLRLIGHAVKKELRALDVVARVGGDEFAILLPETDGERAHLVMSRIQREVYQVCKELLGRPLTLSIGVKTFVQAPATVEDMLHDADQLMYTVKHDHKDAVAFA